MLGSPRTLEWLGAGVNANVTSQIVLTNESCITEHKKGFSLIGRSLFLLRLTNQAPCKHMACLRDGSAHGFVSRFCEEIFARNCRYCTDIVCRVKALRRPRSS